MVAIVTGNPLGLGLGSLSSLGSTGQFGEAALGQSRERSYVNAATGNLVLQDTDSLLAATGGPLATLRTYNSQGRFDNDNNDGWWNAPYKSVVLQADGQLLRTDSDGASQSFAWDPQQGAYLATRTVGHARDRIDTDAAGAWRFTSGRTGRTETYQTAGAGLIVRSADPNGNALTFDYDADGRMRRVTDAAGETVNYAYVGTLLAGVSTSLADGQVLTDVSYGYDAAGRLRTVTLSLDPMGTLPPGSIAAGSYVTTYEYAGTSTRIASVTQGDGTRLAFTWVNAGGTYKVASVTDGDGNLTRFAYNTTARTTTVTDASGAACTYLYDEQGQLLRVRMGVTAGNAKGLDELSYAYDADGNVLSVTDRLAHGITYEYDSRGNQTAQVDALGNRTERRFDAANLLRAETVFTDPATPLTTLYVYDDGGRHLLRYVISPDQRVTEYRYDANGQRVAEIRYTGTEFKGRSWSDATREADLDAFVSGSVDRSHAERTDWAYDWRGQVKSQTAYERLDAAGIGVNASSTVFAHDHRGQLIGAVHADGVGGEAYVYDGLGRVVSSVTGSVADVAQRVTTHALYDDAHGAVTMTAADGLQSVTVVDHAGRVVSVARQAVGADLQTTRYFHDALGHVTMTQDPTGLRTWSLYDAAGRKVADIGPDGALTEYVYDGHARLTRTTRYANAVDTAILVEAAGQPLTNWNANPALAPAGVAAVTLAGLRASAGVGESAWRLYDAADRLVYTVDGNGGVTQTLYDGASRVVGTQRLATPIDTAQLKDTGDQGIDLGALSVRVSLSVQKLGSGPNATRQLTAFVDAGAAGMVNFYAEGKLLGSADLVQGVARLSVANLPIGSTELVAAYSGDGAHLGGVSDSVFELVDAATATTTTLSADAITSGYGATVRLSAGVAGDAPGGMVTFYSDGQAIAVASVAGGQAVADVNSLAIGTHAITARFEGDDRNAASLSGTVSLAVVRSATATAESVTTLLVDNSRTLPGQPVTLTAQVRGAEPTGRVQFYNGTVLLATVDVVNGIATFSTSDLLPGAARLRARYLGDAHNAASTSVTATTVVLATATVTISSAPVGAAFGSAVTLVADVAGSKPTGTVTFLHGTDVLGSTQLVNGQARWTALDGLTVDGDVVAVYSGDGANAIAESDAVAVRLESVATSTALSVSRSDVAAGQAVVLSATLSGASLSYLGDVAFYDGDQWLGTSRIDGTSATLRVDTLPIGQRQLRAVFAGWDRQQASESAAVDVRVHEARFTQIRIDAAASVMLGEPLALSASVDGLDGPTGEVTFYAGSTAIGTGVLADGVARISVASLPAGTSAITARYQGDAAHADSVSAATNVTVRALATQVVLGSDRPSVPYGSHVTLTAAIGSSAPAQDGTVTFFNGRTAIGTAAVLGGVAHLEVDNLPVGNLTLSAGYTGDATHAASVATLSQVVTVADTGIVLSASRSEAPQGTPIILSARVGSVTGSTPTGTVTFSSADQVLGTANVVNGWAALTLTGLPAGPIAVVASYAGDARHAASAASGPALNVVAAPAATTTSLTSSVTTVAQGSDFTLTATVAGGTAGGLVTFVNGTAVLGTALLQADGTATLVTRIRTTGTASLEASHAGDAVATASSVSSRVQVSVTAATLPPATAALPATTTKLTVSTATAQRGEPVVLRAQVSGPEGSAPGGSVAFFSGATLIGSAAVVGGQAALATVSLPAGADALKAVYSGDARLATSSSAVSTTTVALAPTTVALVAPVGALNAGTAVTLTARVAANVAPGGSVTFYADGVALGSGAVTNGMASRSVTLPAGAVNLSVRYAGDANNAASTSATIPVTVGAALAASSVALTTADATLELGAPLRLSADTAADATGTIGFFDGNRLLGTTAIVDGHATLTVAGTSVATMNVRAVYSGDAAHATATSAVASTSVVAASTTTRLDAPARVAVGDPLVLTAAVTGSGNPAGTVRFYRGATLVGSASLVDGQATLTLNNVAAGTSSFTAVYLAAAGNKTSTSAARTVQVRPTAVTVSVLDAAPVSQTGTIRLRVDGRAAGGSLTFFDGDVQVGTATVVDGMAAWTGHAMSVGSHALTAVYSGDAGNAGALCAFTQEVVPVATTLRLELSRQFTTAGSDVLVTAHVEGSDPGGTVTFRIGGRDWDPVPLVNGLAAIRLALPAGQAQVVARYGGDAANAAAAATTVLSVQAPPVGITLSASVARVRQDQSLALTARVVGGRDGGRVVFVSGTTTLGVASLQAGIATLSMFRVDLPAGSNGVVAVYVGDDGHAPTLSAAVNLTVVAVRALATGWSSLIVPTSTRDQGVTQVLGADGLVAATVDATGAVTRMEYDGAGRLVHVVRYATLLPTSPALRAGRSEGIDFDALAGTDDQHTWNFHDAQGRLTGAVDAEGFLTEQSFDANGAVVRIVQYATRVDAHLLGAGMRIDDLRPAATREDRVELRTWDAFGRLASQTDAQGTETRYDYDAVGRVVAKHVAVGTTDLRTATVRYDVQGHLVAELSAVGAALLPSAGSQADIDAVWAAHAVRHTYDAAGRRTSTTDQSGLRTLFFYDEAGRLRYTIDAAGEASEQRYDALGRVVATVQHSRTLDAATLATMAGGVLGSTPGLAAAERALAQLDAAADAVHSFAYNRAGTLVSETDAVGTVTNYSVDALGQWVSSTRAGLEIDWVRDHAGRIVAERQKDLHPGLVDPQAPVAPGPIATQRAWRYDAFGRAISATDANGHETTTTYDRDGRVVQQRDATGATTSFEYDAFGRIALQTDRSGETTRYTYDDAARSVRVTLGAGDDRITYTRTSTRHGEVQALEDARGVVTTYRYDPDGRLTSTDTAGVVTGSRFDAAGRLELELDGRGVLTRTTYDAANRVLTRTRDVGDATHLNLREAYTYDALGRLLTTDANGVITAVSYDSEGHVLTRVVDVGTPEQPGLRLTTVYAYDAAGRVVRVTDPTGVVITYAYDAFGRRTREVVAEGPGQLNLTTQYTYDGRGNVASRTDAEQHVTRYFYDADDRLVFTVDALGDVQRNEYDGEGRLVGTRAYLRPVALTATSTTADVQALVVGADAVREVSFYGSSGQLRFRVDGAGGVTEYRREDGTGRVTTEIHYAGAIQLADLDHPGEVPVLPPPASASDLVIRNFYDALGRPAWTVDGAGGVTYRQFDGNGNLQRLVRFAHKVPDADEWTPQANSPAPDASDEILYTVFDGANRPIYTIDGTNALKAIEYDAQGHVSKRVGYSHPLAVGTALTATGLQAAAASLADWVHDARERQVYDAAGRLAWAVNADGAVTGYTYDGNGNNVREVRYATPMAFDADPATLPVSADDRVTVRLFDAANRETAEVDALGGVTLFGYDGVGNLQDTVKLATRVAAPTTTSNAWDLLNGHLVTTDKDRIERRVYDGANRLTYVLGPEAAVSGWRYDAAGRVIAEVRYAELLAAGLGGHPTPASVEALLTPSSSDRVTLHAWDGAGREVVRIDPMGFVTKMDYDGLGREIQRYEPVDFLLEGVPVTAAMAPFAFELAQNVLFDSGDRTTRHVYDRAGRLAENLQVNVGHEAFDYDGAGRQVHRVDGRNYTWTTTYDAAGRPLSEITPAVYVASVGRVEGIVTRNEYDALGRLVARIEADGLPEQRVTRYEYDAMGRQRLVRFPPVGVYDPSADDLAGNAAAGNIDRHELPGQALTVETFRDVFGEVVATRDTAQAFSYRLFDRLGQVTAEVDAMGYVTAYERDTLGNVTAVTRYEEAVALPAGPVTTPALAAAVAGLAGHPGRTVRTQYDRAGRATLVREPAALVRDGGVSTTASVESLVTRNVYDAFGDVVKVGTGSESQDKAITTYYHDRNGRVIGTVNALGYLTTQLWSRFGHVTEQREWVRNFAASARRPEDDFPLTFGPTSSPWEGDKPGQGAWTFGTRGADDSSGFVAMTVRTEGHVRIWSSADGSEVRLDTVDGRTTVHNGAGRSVIVRWTAPAQGDVAFLALPAHRFERAGFSTRYRDVDAGQVIEFRVDAASEDPPEEWLITLGYRTSPRFEQQFQPQNAGDRYSFYQYDYSGDRLVFEDHGTDTFRAHGSSVSRYAYDEAGNRTLSSNFASDTESVYDAAGRLIEVRHRDSIGSGQREPRTVYQRDGLGNILYRIEGVVGRDAPDNIDYHIVPMLEFWPGAELGSILGVHGDEDRVTAFRYDSHGNVTEQRDAMGHTQFMAYDSRGQLAKQWQAVSDGEGNASRTRTAFTAYQYDALGRLVDEITPGSGMRVEAGQVVEAGAGAPLVHARTTYNAFGEVIRRETSVGDRVDARASYRYDAMGRMVGTDEDGQGWKVTLYDVLGHRTAEIASDGSAAVIAGDDGAAWTEEALRALAQRTADIRRTDYVVDALGRIVEIHLPERVVSSVGPQGGITGGRARPVVYRQLDRWGNVLRESDPRSSEIVTLNRYDFLGRLVERANVPGNGYAPGWGDADYDIDSISGVETHHYDSWGRLDRVSDANRHDTGYTFDAFGRLKEEHHADGGVVRYEYNEFGDRVRMVDAEGNATDYEYDKLGHVTKVRAAGVYVSTVGRQGGSGRLEISESQGLERPEDTYTYDELGHRVSATDGTGHTTRYRFDLRGNLVSTVQPLGQSNRAVFDSQGRQIALQDPNGAVSTWSFDSRGRLVGYVDIGQGVHTMEYDAAGQLVAHTSMTGQDIHYAYDGAGELVTIDDPTIRHVEYSYDAAGHRVRELEVHSTVVQDNLMRYDALGRLRDVRTSDGFHLHYRYDLVGNRTYQSIDGPGLLPRADADHNVTYDATHQEMWYAYDGMNRQVLVDGLHSADLSDDNIDAAQGHIVTYDRNGNRTSDRHWGLKMDLDVDVVNATSDRMPEDDPHKAGYKLLYQASGQAFYGYYTNQSGPGFVTERYGYDARNRLWTVREEQATSVGLDTDHQDLVVDQRHYDAAGRMVQSGPGQQSTAAYRDALARHHAPPDANGSQTQYDLYDANGRLSGREILSGTYEVLQDIRYERVVLGDPQVTDNGEGDVRTTYPDAYSLPGYDPAGNVVDYIVYTPGTGTTSYHVDVARAEGYRERSTTATTGGDVRTSFSDYDRNGHLVGVRDGGTPQNDRTFENDVNGIALVRHQQGHLLRQIVVSGQVLASYGAVQDERDKDKFVNQAQFDPPYQPITAAYPSPSLGAYSVRSGDTLESIAQAVYGDRQLWYLIADANGMSGNGDLRVGQTLNVPNRVGSVHNDVGTVRPYDASRITGSTAPQLPVPQAASGGCGGLGQLITLVVAIAVTAATGGSGGFFSSIFANPAGLALQGSTLTVATGAAAAATGSLASQIVGNVIGVQDGFNWKQVGLAAIGGGVTGGLGSSVADAVTRQTSVAFLGAAAQAAVGSVVTQGIGVATGLQHSFSWQSVIASAAGGAVGEVVGDAMGLNDRDKVRDMSPGARFGARLVTGLAAGAATAVARGGRIAVQQVAAEAFGNALGGGFSGASDGPPTVQGGDQLGEFIGTNMPAWEQRQATFDQLVNAFDTGGPINRADDVLMAQARFRPSEAGSSRPDVPLYGDVYHSYRLDLDYTTNMGSVTVSADRNPDWLRQERYATRQDSAGRGLGMGSATLISEVNLPTMAYVPFEDGFPALEALPASPLPLGWNMRDASAETFERDRQARLASSPNMTEAVSGPGVVDGLNQTAAVIDSISRNLGGAAGYIVGHSLGMRRNDAAAMAAIGATAGELGALRAGFARVRSGQPTNEPVTFGGLTSRSAREASFLGNARATFESGSVFTKAIRFGDDIVIQRSDIAFSIQNVRRMKGGYSPFVRNGAGEYETINLHHIGRQNGTVIEILSSHNRYDPTTGGPLHIPGPGGPIRDLSSREYWKQRLADAIRDGVVPQNVLVQLQRR